MSRSGLKMLAWTAGGFLFGLFSGYSAGFEVFDIRTLFFAVGSALVGFLAVFSSMRGGLPIDITSKKFHTGFGAFSFALIGSPFALTVVEDTVLEGALFVLVPLILGLVGAIVGHSSWQILNFYKELVADSKDRAEEN